VRTLLILSFLIGANAGADIQPLEPLDVFDLEFALDPQVSPDGSRVAYLRQSMDVMSDRATTDIWVVDADGGSHRPLLSGTASFSSPRWSPSGDRLLYVTAAGERGAEVHVRWMDTGQTALLSNLPESPRGLTWSPDGKRIAFSMFVPATGLTLATPPARPEGAQWAPPVTVIDKMPYRADGAGYLDAGYTHVFIMPADGGTPRQLTEGDYNHGGSLSFSPDGMHIAFAANRIDNPLEDPAEAEIWTVNVETGELTALTDRDGPDTSPQYSPDGKSIVYRGYDDELLGYHNTQVYVMDADGGNKRSLTENFDRSVSSAVWAGSSSRLFIRYDDRGQTTVASLDMNGRREMLLNDLGSATVGRPYATGGFSVSDNGVIAYTKGSTVRPSDIAVRQRNGRTRQLTSLNDDLFAKRDAATVEELTWQSGDYEIQGWLVKPVDFDPAKKYPLILEIHGGPFAAYGPHFSPEIQLYASAGYVVLYTNPRGSTSYGAKFANEIHHNYPSKDYDDLMAGVDAAIDLGFVDEDALFVTGGSGGGVLTAWIVGKTDRFKAAVVQKPVINWLSFALTADGSAFFTRYWFASMPWEDPDAYWRRSPLSLVGNVTTPTMLITGEADYRTPMSESEQYYQALKLRGIDSALVRVPERSHNLVGRPSHLIAKAQNILGWFEKYREDSQ